MSEVEGALPQIDVTEIPDATLEDSSLPPDETAAPPEPQKPRGVQVRIDELTRQRHEAERREDQWRETAQRLLSERQAPPKQEEVPEAPKSRPTADQFDSYDQYTEALTDWKVNDALSKQAEKVATERVQMAREQRNQQFWERSATFAKTVSDFDQVTRAAQVSEPMAEAIASSENGAALLYHLGRNPQLAGQIANMPPMQAAVTLGRLEAQISATPTTRISAAPAPINALSGASGNSVDPEKMTGDEFVAWRNHQLYGSKK